MVALFISLVYNICMKRTLYRVLVYVSIAVSLIGLVLMIVITAKTGDLNVWASLCLCLMIIGIISLILVQCIYRVTKKQSDKLSKTKVCPKCNTINDYDAEYCKNCGEKFRMF